MEQPGGNFKRTLQVGIILLCICAALYMLGTLIAPFVLISLEDKIVATKLDNRYIDSGYSDWQTIDIAEFGSLNIPGSWEVFEDSSIYTITDNNTTIIAYGAAFCGEEPQYSTYSLFLQEVFGDKIKELIFAANNDFAILNPCEFGTLKIQNETGWSTLRYLKLYINYDKRMLFIFPQTSSINDQELFEIAEAIAYSYYFG